MAQAGPDVLAVVVTLLLIESGLSTQALECGLELHQLCLPPLPVPALVTDVLGLGNQGRGELAISGRRTSGPDPGPRTTHCEDLQEKQEEGDFKAVFVRRSTISRMPSQPTKDIFRTFPTEE